MIRIATSLSTLLVFGSLVGCGAAPLDGPTAEKTEAPTEENDDVASTSQAMTRNDCGAGCDRALFRNGTLSEVSWDIYKICLDRCDARYP